MNLRFRRWFLLHELIQGFPSLPVLDDMGLFVPVVRHVPGPTPVSRVGHNLPRSLSNDLRVLLDSPLQFGMCWRESEDDWEFGFPGGAMTDLVGDDSVNECHFVILVEFVCV